MGAQEAPAGKKAAKPSGKKVDADALKLDVKAFASQLGLVSGGGGDDAFSDFASSKAKQSIAARNKPNKRQRLNDDVDGAAPSGRGAAAPSHKQQAAAPKQNGERVGPVGKRAKPSETDQGKERRTKQAGGNQPRDKSVATAHGGDEKSGDLKSRDWNFGVGPRPGESKGFKSLLGKSESNIWYHATAKAATNAATTPSNTPVDPDLYEHRRAAAEALMEAEVNAFEKELQRRNPSDAKWLLQIRRGGTSTDKLAATTLLVQESVVANMRALDQLIGWATKRSGGKELVRQAMEGLQELFMTVVLPSRKLKFLEQQPLQDLPPGRDGEKQLLLWWTEDCIKRRYAMFVAALEEHSKDNLEFLKEKSMRVMYELLVSKPECEARLLAALVNKLGDPARQVASKAVYLVMQLLSTHPVMKPVVVREVERFVFRPGLADKARYYAVVFLNQVPLSHRASEGGDALAKQLISVYFTLFRMVVEGHIGSAAQLRKQQEERYAEEKKKFWREQAKAERQGGKGGRGGRGGAGGRGRQRPPPPPKMAVAEEVDARLLSGLITGVRRAFPFVQPADVEPLVEESAGQLFRMVHTAPFTVAVQSLVLLYQLMSARAAISDRYYRALYAALDREGPTTSSRAPMFLALLFKAMQGDVSVKRVAAFAKRLLQLATSAQPNWTCGALVLLSQVLAAQPALWASISHPEDLGGSGLEEFKELEDLDDDDDGPETFRDVDGSEDDEGEKKNGAVHVYGNGIAVTGGKAKSNGVKKAGGAATHDSDDEDAELAGVDMDLIGNRRGMHAFASSSGRGAPEDAKHRPPAGSFAAKATAAVAEARAAVEDSVWPKSEYYCMDKREPLYANADRSCWWELTALAAHAHPSVSAMARSLLAGAPVVFDGDPLRDLSLVAFLDKFVNKKPKPVARGSSLMQPTAPLGGVVTAKGPGRQAAGLAQLSSEAFAAMAEAQVDSADLFFHKFLNLKGVKDKRAARTNAKEAKRACKDGGGWTAVGAAESLSDEDEDEVERYMAKQEGMADDALGDPDMGYDYDQLAEALEKDTLGADSDDMEEDDEEEDGASDADEVGDYSADDDEASDDSLEGVNVLELPSPSDDDEPDEQLEDANTASERRKRAREALKAAGLRQEDLQNLSSDDDEEEGEEDEEGSGSSDLAGEGGEEEEDDDDELDEDELQRLINECSDDEDGEEDKDEYMSDGLDEEEEPVQKGSKKDEKAAAGGKKGEGGKKGKGGGGNLFASAEDYEALIDKAEKEELEGRGKEGALGEGRRGGKGGRDAGRGRGRGWGGEGRGRRGRNL